MCSPLCPRGHLSRGRWVSGEHREIKKKAWVLVRPFFDVKGAAADAQMGTILDDKRGSAGFPLVVSEQEYDKGKNKSQSSL